MLSCFLAVLILFVPGNVMAEIYQWVDKNGEVHMSTTPPSPNSAKEVRTHKEEDDLLNSDLVFLNKLYTRESYLAEKERLKEQVRYFKEDCRDDGGQRQGKLKSGESYCADNAARNQRSLDVLMSDPDRYFYVLDQQKGSQTDETPIYQPWE